MGLYFRINTEVNRKLHLGEGKSTGERKTAENYRKSGRKRAYAGGYKMVGREPGRSNFERPAQGKMREG